MPAVAPPSGAAAPGAAREPPEPRAPQAPSQPAAPSGASRLASKIGLAGIRSLRSTSPAAGAAAGAAAGPRPSPSQPGEPAERPAAAPAAAPAVAPAAPGTPRRRPAALARHGEGGAAEPRGEGGRGAGAGAEAEAEAGRATPRRRSSSKARAGREEGAAAAAPCEAAGASEGGGAGQVTPRRRSRVLRVGGEGGAGPSDPPEGQPEGGAAAVPSTPRRRSASSHEPERPREGGQPGPATPRRRSSSLRVRGTSEEEGGAGAAAAAAAEAGRLPPVRGPSTPRGDAAEAPSGPRPGRAARGQRPGARGGQAAPQQQQAQAPRAAPPRWLTAYAAGASGAAAVDCREVLEVQGFARRLLDAVYEASVDEETAVSVLDEQPELAWLAQCLQRCPLPPCWTCLEDEGASDNRCYMNTEDETTIDEPPLMSRFADLARLMNKWRKIPSSAGEVSQKLGNHRDAALLESEDIRKDWIGPHTDAATGEEFWSCPATGRSSWGDPGAATEFFSQVADRLQQALPAAAPASVGLPRPLVDSPRPRAGSPRPLTGSPRPLAGSPRPLAGSPRPLAGSPRPLAASPRDLASLSPRTAGARRLGGAGTSTGVLDQEPGLSGATLAGQGGSPAASAGGVPPGFDAEASRLVGTWTYGGSCEYHITRAENGQLFFHEGHFDREADVVVRTVSGRLRARGRWFYADLSDSDGRSQGEVRLRNVGDADGEDSPGMYVLTQRAAVAPSVNLANNKDILTELDIGSTVRVVEVVHHEEQKRVRARLESPGGWISLVETVGGYRWAEKQGTVVSNFRLTMEDKWSADTIAHRRADEAALRGEAAALEDAERCGAPVGQTPPRPPSGRKVASRSPPLPPLSVSRSDASPLPRLAERDEEATPPPAEAAAGAPAEAAAGAPAAGAQEPVAMPPSPRREECPKVPPVDAGPPPPPPSAPPPPWVVAMASRRKEPETAGTGAGGSAGAAGGSPRGSPAPAKSPGLKSDSPSIFLVIEEDPLDFGLAAAPRPLPRTPPPRACIAADESPRHRAGPPGTPRPRPEAAGRPRRGLRGRFFASAGGS